MKRSKGQDPLMGTLPFRTSAELFRAACNWSCLQSIYRKIIEQQWLWGLLDKAEQHHRSTGGLVRPDWLNTVRCARVMEGWSMKAVWERKQIFPIRLTLAAGVMESRYKYQLFPLMHSRAAGRTAKRLEEIGGCLDVHRENNEVDYETGEG